MLNKNMQKALLIQANGNNVRLGKFFKQPKYELYYNGQKIINHICNNIKQLEDTAHFIAIRDDFNFKDTSGVLNVINCKPTYSRLDTLKNIIEKFDMYNELIIHDCDVIIESNILKKLTNNSIAVSTYKGDGLKYGFIFKNC